MAVASTFMPQQGDAATGESRRQEPSMEDILASIRRIIADDQGTRAGHGDLDAALSPTPTATSGPEQAGASVSAVDFARAGVQPRPYEEVIDLANMPSASLADHAEAVYEEPTPAASEPEPAVQQEPEREEAVITSAGYGSLQWAPERRTDQLPPPRLRSSRTEASMPPPESAASEPRGPQGDQGERESPAVAETTEEAGDSLISPALGASVMSAFETLAATVMLQNTEMLERIMRELLRPMVKVWLDENLPTLVERLVRTEIERVARGGRG